MVKLTGARLCGGAVILSLCLSACHGGAVKGPDRESETEARQTKDPSTDSRETTDTRGQETTGSETAGMEQSGSRSGQSVKVLENLGDDGTLLSADYRKSGDIQARMYFYLPEGDDSDRLKCMIDVSPEKDNDETLGYGIGIAEFSTEKERQSYNVFLDITNADPSLDLPQQISPATLTFHLNESGASYISVEGNEQVAGDYYVLEQCYDMPDLFNRRLSRVELYPYTTEELWLLRNGIYAAYGRKFTSEVLNEYFSKQPWYRGTVEPENFSESVFSEIEKANILLIQEIENQKESRRESQFADYEIEGFDFAPYLSWLDNERETGLRADISKAEDMGVYYRMPGRISIPVTITQEQYDTVKSGGEVEVAAEDFGGETAILKQNPETEENYGYEFLLSKKGGEQTDYYIETGVRKNYKTGEYKLWQTSDDTIMKTVYEGEVYILKGAVFGMDVGLAGASLRQEEIKIPAGQGMVNFYDDSIGGNFLRHNGRGYFTAIYSLGD